MKVRNGEIRLIPAIFCLIDYETTFISPIAVKFHHLKNTNHTKFIQIGHFKFLNNERETL
jgi:hypothetical protein